MSQSLVRPVFFSTSGILHIRRLRQSLDAESAATLVHTFVTSRVDYCNAVLAGSPKITTDTNFNFAASVVSNTRKFDSGLSRLLHDELHWLDVADRVQSPCWCTMSSWNSSAVHDGKLHTNIRRRQSSTPAARQSAEDDRSAVLNGQLWSSVFRCCGSVDLEFAAMQTVFVTQL